MATFNVSMDFGDEEPVTFIVEAIDHSQAIFIAATMVGANSVVTQYMMGNMHLDIRPAAKAAFGDSWPTVTIETVTDTVTE